MSILNRIKILVLIVIITCNILSFSKTYGTDPSFQKYSNFWFYPEISHAFEKGWIDYTTFLPDSYITVDDFLKLVKKSICNNDNEVDYRNAGTSSNLTKLQAAEIICKALKLSPSKRATVYCDTSDGYAQLLYDKGILRPIKDNGKYYFKPDENLTFAEAALLVVNTQEYKQSPGFMKNRTVKTAINLPILTYHSLSENPSDWTKYTISPDRFKKDMELLKSWGYTTVSMLEVIAYTEGYVKHIPDKPIVITFDDGYADNYTYAFNIAKELNIKFVIFTIGNAVNFPESKGNKLFLTVEQMKEMYQSGLVDIQNHTFAMHTQSHNKLIHGIQRDSSETYEDFSKRITCDLKKCDEAIAKNVGQNVRTLSYPFGIYSQDSDKAVRMAGYSATYTTRTGVNKLSNGLFSLRRINMSDNLDRNSLKSILIKNKCR